MNVTKSWLRSLSYKLRGMTVSNGYGPIVSTNLRAIIRPRVNLHNSSSPISHRLSQSPPLHHSLTKFPLMSMAARSLLEPHTPVTSQLSGVETVPSWVHFIFHFILDY